MVDETYITEKAGYAEERINISNAIIYYDMINKSDHGFNSNMNSTDINLDSGSIFAPPSEKARRHLMIM